MKRYLARNHKFYIQESGNWIQISGVASWSVSYQSSLADLTKFNDFGWSGSIVTDRSGAIILDGFYLVDATTGQRDYGQQLCESAANGLGFHALRVFKVEAFDDNLNTIGYILASGVFSRVSKGGAVSAVMPWGTTINFKGIPIGNGIYNIFSQESYPPPEPDISRSGMWTGVLGMYTYAE